jgi:hypothetical protein
LQWQYCLKGKNPQRLKPLLFKASTYGLKACRTLQNCLSHGDGEGVLVADDVAVERVPLHWFATGLTNQPR